MKLSKKTSTKEKNRDTSKEKGNDSFKSPGTGKEIQQCCFKKYERNVGFGNKKYAYRSKGEIRFF